MNKSKPPRRRHQPSSGQGHEPVAKRVTPGRNSADPRSTRSRLTNILVRGSLLVLGLLLASPASEAAAQLVALPPQPWPNSRPITFSFAPDLVEVGRHRNELFQVMNDQMSFPDWQIEIARALQTWSRHAGLQFAWRPDTGRAFGVPGLSQGDPRFGDIRFGAFPQTNVLGNAVPFNSAAGSWAGDVLFDSSRQFYLHRPGDDIDPGRYDLYSVALHEIGNSLGLVDVEDDPDSVMFFAYVGPRQGLTPADINRLRDLYGPPVVDRDEPLQGNDRWATATKVEPPQNFSKERVAQVAGRIGSAQDIDIYKFVATGHTENCWLRLEAQGRSLLCARMTAYDSQFAELATISAENPLDNSLVKEVTGLAAGDVFYVVVEGADIPDFDFGDYNLIFDWNENGGQTADDDDDRPQAQFWEASDRDWVNRWYAELGLVDNEVSANNTFRQATRLYTAPGAPAGSRFELISAISSATDLDTYRIRTSASATGALVVDLSLLGLDPARLDVRVFDAQQKSLPVQRKFRTNGDVMASVSGVRPNSEYFVRVLNRSGNSVASNYLLQVNVSERTADLQQLERVALNATQADQFGELLVYKTQLFRLDLSMSSAQATTQATQMTIYSDSGQVELVTSVRSGQPATAYVWLQAGRHHLRFTARTRNGNPILPAIVVLAAASVSDDEGPVLIDPSGNPVSGPQQPGNQPTPPPRWDFPQTFVWLRQLAIPPDNPWF